VHDASSLQQSYPVVVKRIFAADHQDTMSGTHIESEVASNTSQAPETAEPDGATGTPAAATADEDSAVVQSALKVFRFVGDVPVMNLKFISQITFLKGSFIVWVGPFAQAAEMPNLVRSPSPWSSCRCCTMSRYCLPPCTRLSSTPVLLPVLRHCQFRRDSRQLHRRLPSSRITLKLVMSAKNFRRNCLKP